jgi:8-oxo-dGTP pyrophosphatase MutT (NUDIX family)
MVLLSVAAGWGDFGEGSSDPGEEVELLVGGRRLGKSIWVFLLGGADDDDDDDDAAVWL